MNKQIKDLQNKISSLEEELERMKQFNQFLCQYVKMKKDSLITFATRCEWTGIDIEMRTVITYVYKAKIHEIIMIGIGDEKSIKLIKNEENSFIFEDVRGSRWIVNKSEEIVTKLPKDTLFVEIGEVRGSCYKTF